MEREAARRHFRLRGRREKERTAFALRCAQGKKDGPYNGEEKEGSLALLGMTGHETF
jgi:hypothetical protein